MPVSSGSPNHSNDPLLGETATSSHASSGDESTDPNSPLYSPTSPSTPSYNFEPSTKTPQLSMLGAVQGSSRDPSFLPHHRLKALYGKPPGATRMAQHPLQEVTAESEVSQQDVNVSKAVHRGTAAEDSERQDIDKGEEEAGEQESVIDEVEEGLEEGAEEVMEPKERIVVLDFDALYAQYMPNEVDGRLIKFTVDVQPENYKDHVLYLNRGWGDAVSIKDEIAEIDIPMIPHRLDAAAEVDEPGSITALKSIKASGYLVYLVTAREVSFKANIEDFLKLYNITVGEGPGDVVIAIRSYTPEEEGNSLESQIELSLDGAEAEAAVDQKMLRLLSHKHNAKIISPHNAKTLRRINPTFIISFPSTNDPKNFYPDAPPQDPDYPSAYCRTLGVEVLTFGVLVKDDSGRRHDDVERGMRRIGYNGWVGVVKFLEGCEERKGGVLQRLDMSQCVVVPKRQYIYH